MAPETHLHSGEWTHDGTASVIRKSVVENGDKPYVPLFTLKEWRPKGKAGLYVRTRGGESMLLVDGSQEVGQDDSDIELAAVIPPWGALRDDSHLDE